MTEPDEFRDGKEPATAPAPALRMFGEDDAFACEGDSCALPVVTPQG